MYTQFGALDQHTGSFDSGTTVIAASATADADRARDVLLEELIRTNGEPFGIGMLAGAPISMSCAFGASRDRLIDSFVDCFNAARDLGMEPLEDLEQIVALEPAEPAEPVDGEDEEYDVEDAEPRLRAAVAAYLKELPAPE